MLPWTDVVGDAPTYLLEPIETLPPAYEVLERIRAGGHPKVVALVGYREDAEASEVSRHLPYGYRGEGIEEIVFSRETPADILQFEDDAWPGEDRTFVQDDVDAALELINEFAVEYGAQGSVVLVTGHAEFVAEIADKLRGC
ncbi:hypothetical protein J2X11_002395 [Aeromicrobium panaciterrae]|uniref:Uncharacterized protein n=1 Tax=Aeromicrobium panaciterrae TaxID=363861 RepID=A0ABU1UQV9_9ACTN|nr:hypothetical protein [Aeromicrobium panaciterrae]MDR7087556.1 hypothetical protein [Aeromicrobium panaciterrae]